MSAAAGPAGLSVLAAVGHHHAHQVGLAAVAGPVAAAANHHK